MRFRFLLVVFASLLFAAPAFAGDINVTFGFKAGTLGVRAPATSLGAGTVQVPVTVVDARGNGAGWTLRVTGAGSPAVTKITARCAAGSTCTLPTASLSLPAAVGSSPTAILAAARNSGMGAMELTLTVSGGHGPLVVSVR